MYIYVVKPNDTLEKISKQHSIPVSKILNDNNMKINDTLLVGESLLLNKTDVNPNKLGKIDVNGYAYPNVKRDVLNNILPYLTYISIFAYEADGDGNLNSINDDEIIELARKAGVAPLMCIINKRFSSVDAQELLTSKKAKDNFLKNVANIMKTKNYYGINFDFENIKQENKQDYNNFLRDTTKFLNDLGYEVFTALAPKTSAQQQGRLYTAHDYKIHNIYANKIIIMTYEWGYRYSKPRAVSPVNMVKKVLDYAITDINPNKILLGMPDYGYDWSLPWEPRKEARSISTPIALSIARKYKPQIMYDYTAQSPHYTYTDENNIVHKVWFEDARSVYQKLLLVDEYNLAGVSYWTINSFFKPNWLILSYMYDINKVTL